MSGFISLFFMKCSYFHIENNLKNISEHCLRINFSATPVDHVFFARIEAYIYIPHAPPCCGDLAKEV